MVVAIGVGVMVDETDRCALDGCDEVIIQPLAADQARKYCCAAHRISGRKQRRAEHVELRLAESAERGAAGDADSAAKTAFTVPAEKYSLPDSLSIDATTNAGPFDAEEPADVELPASLRAKAGKARTKPAQRLARGQGRGARRDTAMARARRHGAVALGVVGALVGGTVIVATRGNGDVPAAVRSPSAGQPTPQAPANTGQGTAAPAAPPNTDQWAEQARVKLASVHEQLGAIAKAEAKWRAMPAVARSGKAPSQVTAMAAQKVALQQLKTTLESQLAAPDSLKRAQSSLTGVQSERAGVEQALSTAPTEQSSTEQTAAPEQLAPKQQLLKQRDMLAEQEKMLTQQVDRWQTSISTAAASPLPDLHDTTAPIVKSVLGLTQQPQQPTSPRSSTPQPPRVPHDPSRPPVRTGEVGTGAPPNPTPKPGPSSPTQPRPTTTPAAPASPVPSWRPDATDGDSASTPAPAPRRQRPFPADAAPLPGTDTAHNPPENTAPHDQPQNDQPRRAGEAPHAVSTTTTAVHNILDAVFGGRATTPVDDPSTAQTPSGDLGTIIASGVKAAAGEAVANHSPAAKPGSAPVAGREPSPAPSTDTAGPTESATSRSPATQARSTPRNNNNNHAPASRPPKTPASPTATTPERTTTTTGDGGDEITHLVNNAIRTASQQAHDDITSSIDDALARARTTVDRETTKAKTATSHTTHKH